MSLKGLTREQAVYRLELGVLQVLAQRAHLLKRTQDEEETRHR